MADNVLTIYGDSGSGNCHKVKFVADLLGIACRWIEIDVGKAWVARIEADLGLRKQGMI